MYRLSLGFGLLFFCATQAAAGPWPREKGKTFTSVAGSYRYAPDPGQTESDGSFYLEYGLGHRITLGFDATDDQSSYSHAFVFIRHSVLPAERALKLSMSLGVGVSRRDNDWEPMARLGFAIGRSTQIIKSGWWSISAAVEDHRLWDAPIYKLDATFGINLGPRWKSFLEVETSQRRGSSDSVTIRQSLAWQMRPGTHLVFGLEAKEVGTQSFGVRAGWWHEF